MGPIINKTPIQTRAWVKEHNIIPASSSSVQTMETCPMQFSGRYGITMEKVKQQDNPASIYGNLVHQSCEDYLKHHTPINDKFQREMPGILRKLNWVRNHKGFMLDGVEQRMAINEFGACNWRDRTIGVIADDMLYPSEDLGIYLDWKTADVKNWKGVPKQPKHMPIQMEMTGLVAFVSNPNMKYLICSLEYLRHDARLIYVFDRSKDTYTWFDHKGKEHTAKFQIHLQLNEYWKTQQLKSYTFRISPLCKGWCPVTTCPNWSPLRKK